jgi:hypothetical protein
MYTTVRVSNAIAYHFIQEKAVLKVIKIAYEPLGSELQVADALIKVQLGPKRQVINIIKFYGDSCGLPTFPFSTN